MAQVTNAPVMRQPAQEVPDILPLMNGDNMPYVYIHKDDSEETKRKSNRKSDTGSVKSQKSLGAISVFDPNTTGTLRRDEIMTMHICDVYDDSVPAATSNGVDGVSTTDLQIGTTEDTSTGGVHTTTVLNGLDSHTPDLGGSKADWTGLNGQSTGMENGVTEGTNGAISSTLSVIQQDESSAGAVGGIATSHDTTNVDSDPVVQSSFSKQSQGGSYTEQYDINITSTPQSGARHSEYGASDIAVTAGPTSAGSLEGQNSNTEITSSLSSSSKAGSFQLQSASGDSLTWNNSGEGLDTGRAEVEQGDVGTAITNASGSRTSDTIGHVDSSQGASGSAKQAGDIGGMVSALDSLEDFLNSDAASSSGYDQHSDHIEHNDQAELKQAQTGSPQQQDIYSTAALGSSDSTGVQQNIAGSYRLKAHGSDVSSKSNSSKSSKMKSDQQRESVVSSTSRSSSRTTSRSCPCSSGTRVG